MARMGMRSDSGTKDSEINQVKRDASKDKSELIKRDPNEGLRVDHNAKAKWEALKDTRLETVLVSKTLLGKILKVLQAKEESAIKLAKKNPDLIADFDPEYIAILNECMKHARSTATTIDESIPKYWDPKDSENVDDSVITIKIDGEKDNE